jgi:hypothetical protein
MKDIAMAIALFRQFAARLARERGVSDEAARRQLGFINRAARSILAAVRERNSKFSLVEV